METRSVGFQRFCSIRRVQSSSPSQSQPPHQTSAYTGPYCTLTLTSFQPKVDRFKFGAGVILDEYFLSGDLGEMAVCLGELDAVCGFNKVGGRGGHYYHLSYYSSRLPMTFLVTSALSNTRLSPSYSPSTLGYISDTQLLPTHEFHLPPPFPRWICS